MFRRPTVFSSIKPRHPNVPFWRSALICGVLVVIAVTAEAPAQEELAEEQAQRANIEAVSAEEPLSGLDREHWSFQPIVRHELPRVQNAEWSANPIDRFVLHRLEEQSLAPLPTADRATLLRRISYDLTGLPPADELRDGFLRTVAPLAWEQVVEQLLASTAFGEHWAQYWLDLVRFAETDGFEHDHVRQNAWRYRDWVIDALNAGMPYDEFLRRQIAGDEFYPHDPSAMIATGFLLCGPDMPDINLKEERRHVFLNDMTGTVGGVVLGLTFECAACHDHKYDPISQYDFYRLRAIFETTEPFEEQSIATSEDLRAMEEFDWKRATRWKEIEEELKVLKSNVESGAAAKIEDLQKELAALKKLKAPPGSMARAVRARRAKELTPARLWIKGDFRRPGPEVTAHAPRIMFSEPDDNSSLSRREFVDALLSPENPLTARVIVNRLWTYHFGTGLCGTPSDLGIMGDYVKQKELLDWLASELIRQHWDLKAIQRLIVTSKTYQLASAPTPESKETWLALQEADPDNRLLGRRERRRLSGEELRDALLDMTGELNDDRYGPGVRPPLPKEVVSTLLKNQWPVSENVADHQRRSVYLFVRRNLTFPMFQVLDKPDANRSCPVRNETTIAPQALELMNSEFMQERASLLAHRLTTIAGNETDEFVDAACQTIWGRRPTAAERTAAIRFLSLDNTESRTDFCLTLINANAFLYVD